MPTKSELQTAVRNILDDVIEQSFRHLIDYPQTSDELNHIIREATEEFNYLYLKIDAHEYHPKSAALENHYTQISRDLQKKSLHLLSRLQRIQLKDNINVRDERP